MCTDQGPVSVVGWVDYFLAIAKTLTMRSNCIRAQVGAVIVGTDKKIKATGYNGTPTGILSCMEKGSCYRVDNNIASGTCYETCRSIHAEQNAIIQAGQDRCKDATIYIYGHEQVCILCRRFIIQAGIKHVWLKKDDNSEVKYIGVRDLEKGL